MLIKAVGQRLRLSCSKALSKIAINEPLIFKRYKPLSLHTRFDIVLNVGASGFDSRGDAGGLAFDVGSFAF